jgi:hypothetical protein
LADLRQADQPCNQASTRFNTGTKTEPETEACSTCCAVTGLLAVISEEVRYVAQSSLQMFDGRTVGTLLGPVHHGGTRGTSQRVADIDCKTNVQISQTSLHRFQIDRFKGKKITPGTGAVQPTSAKRQDRPQGLESAKSTINRRATPKADDQRGHVLDQEGFDKLSEWAARGS